MNNINININSMQNFGHKVLSTSFVRNEAVTENSSSSMSNPVQSNQPQAPVNAVYTPIQPKPAKKTGEIKIPGCQNAQIYELANGQKVVAIKKQGPMTINTYVKVGSINETDDIRGISHYIEHNLFNGSSNLKPNEFVEDVKKMGGLYNAATGFASTNYFISSPVHSKEDFDKMLGIHANMLEAPTFTMDTLDKEKGIVCSEIQMLEDQPYQKAQNLLLKNLFQIDTKSSDLIGGSVGNIQNLNRNKVNEYYQKYYTPDNMVTVIVGDIDPDETAQKLNKLFISRRSPSAEKRYEPLNPIEKSVRQDIKCDSINSASVNIGFIGPKNNDIKGEVAVNALLLSLAGNDNTALSKALSKYNTYIDYSTEMVSNNPEDRSAVLLSASFNDSDSEAGLKAIYEGIHKAKSQTLSNGDLQAIKNSLKKQYKITAESSMYLTQMIGTATVTNKIEDIEKSYEMIDQLTTEDIQKAADEFLDLNKASIVVLHPKSTTVGQNVSFKGNFHSDAADKLDMGQVDSYNLSNNMRVDYHQASTSFSYLTMGLKNPNIKNTEPGCDLLLATMLNMGSAYTSKEDFNNKALREGVDIGFYAKNNQIMINAKSDTGNIKAGINLAKEVLLAPNFSQENFEKAKAQLRLEYQSSPKTPDDKVGEELFPDNPNFTSYDKAIKNLDYLTIDDVKSLYFGIMSDAIAKTTISAPEKEKQRNLTNLQGISLKFKPYEYKFNPDTYELKENEVLIQSEDRNQASIEKVYKIKLSGNIKDTATMMVLNSVLSNGKEGLFEDLREKQKLAYAVKSNFITNNKDAILQLNIKTTTQDPDNGLEYHQNVQKSIEGFNKHINKLVNEKVTEEDLNAAKLALLSKVIFNTESTGGKHAQISQNSESFYGTDYTKEFVKAVENVTAEDVQKAAQINFKKPAVTSLIASQETLDKNAAYLRTQGTIKQG